MWRRLLKATLNRSSSMTPSSATKTRWRTKPLRLIPRPHLNRQATRPKPHSTLRPPPMTTDSNAGPGPNLNPDQAAGQDREFPGASEPVAPVSSGEALEAATDIAAEDAIGAAAEPGPGATAAELALRVQESEAVAEEESEEEGDESEDEPHASPPERLDRLQKILAQAGVASRRHAEQLITEGRVQVNGEVVSTLGAKADAARDHIRVDGKLIHGAERLRYYLLNKPKGYVTTVSDPEGRPTIMQLFAKRRERLYPVGRLDYQSEGLLLVTNDGDLANKLTQAASGVEKTYLVKISGHPTADELEILRHGVTIDRTQPGEGKVQTAPARIREVRHGDNPWYEVVLTEGRNRELRKMFSAIGHFVEKIRRVGYGPLVLDVEPGRFRELEPRELVALQRAAAGKGEPRRVRGASVLPRDAGKPAEQHGKSVRPARPERPVRDKGERREFRPRKSEGQREFGDRPAHGPAGKPRGSRPDRTGGFQREPGRGRPDRPPRAERAFSPRQDRGFKPREEGRQRKPFRKQESGEPRDRQFKPRPERAFGERPFKSREDRSFKPRGDRPFKQRDERSAPRAERPFKPREEGRERKPFRKSESAERPARGRNFAPKPGGEGFGGARPGGGKSGGPRGESRSFSRGKTASPKRGGPKPGGPKRSGGPRSGPRPGGRPGGKGGKRP